MEFEQIIEWLKKPDELIDPRVVDTLLFEISGFIGDYEERLAEVDQRVAVKEDELVEKFGTNAKGRTKLKLEPIYIEQQDIERRIRQLKTFKSNLRRRYEILTSTFR